MNQYSTFIISFLVLNIDLASKRKFGVLYVFDIDKSHVPLFALMA